MPALETVIDQFVSGKWLGASCSVIARAGSTEALRRVEEDVRFASLCAGCAGCDVLCAISGGLPRGRQVF